MRIQIFRVKKPSCKILKTKICVPFEVQYYSSQFWQSICLNVQCVILTAIYIQENPRGNPNNLLFKTSTNLFIPSKCTICNTHCNICSKKNKIALIYNDIIHCHAEYFYVQSNFGRSKSPVSNTRDRSNSFVSPSNFPIHLMLKYTPGSNSDGSNSKHGPQGDFFM